MQFLLLLLLHFLSIKLSYIISSILLHCSATNFSVFRNNCKKHYKGHVRKLFNVKIIFWSILWQIWFGFGNQTPYTCKNLRKFLFLQPSRNIWTLLCFPSISIAKNISRKACIHISIWKEIWISKMQFKFTIDFFFAF